MAITGTFMLAEPWQPQLHNPVHHRHRGLSWGSLTWPIQTYLITPYYIQGVRICRQLKLLQCKKNIHVPCITAEHSILFKHCKLYTSAFLMLYNTLCASTWRHHDLLFNYYNANTFQITSQFLYWIKMNLDFFATSLFIIS